MDNFLLRLSDLVGLMPVLIYTLPPSDFILCNSRMCSLFSFMKSLTCIDKFLLNRFFSLAAGASSNGVSKSAFITRLTMSLATEFEFNNEFELEALRALCWWISYNFLCMNEGLIWLLIFLGELEYRRCGSVSTGNGVAEMIESYSCTILVLSDPSDDFSSCSSFPSLCCSGLSILLDEYTVL